MEVIDELKLLLASALIALPVAGFTIVELSLPDTPAAFASASSEFLGDLSALEVILAETQTLANSDDLTAAEARITDFETAWDDAETTMRPRAPDAWGNVDAAADNALSPLRNGRPDPAAVTEALAALSSVLVDPLAGGGSGGAVGSRFRHRLTDANGHPIPCEAMLGDLRTALAVGAFGASDKEAANGLQSKATERCNAGDDTRANAFSAQTLALASH